MSERVPRRRLLLALAAAPLAGCGFRPLNAPPEPGETAIGPELAAVRVGRLYFRTGQLMHQALERRLVARSGEAVAARYELAVVPTTSIESQGFRRDGTPSRFRMVMSTNWSLNTLTVPPRTVATGNVRTFDSYNFIDGQYFPSIVSSETAERRLIEQTADDLLIRLAIALRELPAA